MNRDKIYIAGHNGMVGSALLKKLKQNKDIEIITRSRKELDLINQSKVQDFFSKEQPDQVYLAAAKVGGIYANNSYPADFIYQNLMIQSNIINSAFLAGVKKILFLGSSCIYPKITNYPMAETELLSGKLEPTNEPYAVAKIAGIKMIESYNRQYSKSHKIDYRSVMPSNLYGPGDNYHPKNSHVIPGLLNRFHNAMINKDKSVLVWGSGLPRREFLYVDDMAAASIHVMNLDKSIYEQHTQPMLSHINVGSGTDVTIKDLALMIKDTTKFQGDIEFDNSMVDGSLQKVMDCSRLESLGWKASIKLEEGLRLAYKDYLMTLPN